MLAADMQRPGSIYIGNFGPIPLFVDPSAVILLVYVLLFLGGPISTRLIALAVIVLSVVIHELGHAVIARWRKADGVAIYVTGLGGLCTYRASLQPKEQIMISIAGPIMNFVLALLGWLMLKFGFTAMSPEMLDTEFAELLFVFVLYLFYFNLFIGIFNSLPIYPMDGGKTLFAALHWKGYSEFRCKRWTLITSFVAAGAGAMIYTLWTGEPIGTLLTIILLLILYQAYVELS